MPRTDDRKAHETPADDGEGLRAPGLFREEAIRRYLDRSGRGELLRLTPGWIRGTYWLLLSVAVAAAGFLSFARVEVYASGPAIVRARPAGGFEVEAFLTGWQRPRLRPGLPLVVTLDGEPRRVERLRIETLDDRLISADEARRRLGVAAPGDPAVGRPCAVARASVPAGAFGGGAYDGMTGRAEAPVRSERVGRLLLPALAGDEEP